MTPLCVGCADGSGPRRSVSSEVTLSRALAEVPAVGLPRELRVALTGLALAVHLAGRTAWHSPLPPAAMQMKKTTPDDSAEVGSKRNAGGDRET